MHLFKGLSMGQAERAGMDKSIANGGQQIVVSEEIVAFFKKDRRRRAAQNKSDERHLSKSSFETVLPLQKLFVSNSLENEVIKSLLYQRLREVVVSLTDDEQRLIQMYYVAEFSMERIGKLLGVSKTTISKRLKKLYVKMRGLL